MTGKKLRRAAGPVDARLMHWCPGCEEVHGYRVEGEGGPKWVFNGSFDKPTFTPSMLISVTERTDDDDQPLPAPIVRTLCHYFITDGNIQFCNDSPHALAGKTVPLPDWPYAPGTYGGVEDQ